MYYCDGRLSSITLLDVKSLEFFLRSRTTRSLVSVAWRAWTTCQGAGSWKAEGRPDSSAPSRAVFVVLSATYVASSSLLIGSLCHREPPDITSSLCAYAERSCYKPLGANVGSSTFSSTIGADRIHGCTEPPAYSVCSLGLSSPRSYCSRCSPVREVASSGDLSSDLKVMLFAQGHRFFIVSSGEDKGNSLFLSDSAPLLVS
uniref:Uncharacterized protein n=1 Tax=Steinernema glaseri TaxID=37863 RepID=A0A1I8AV16_9BILA